jgi:dCTP deaminase
MILSGREIKRRLGKDIFIEPFDQRQLGPNSYNLRLHNELMLYNADVLDMKEKPEVSTVTIGPDGFELQPGVLYLARTIEHTRTLNCVPMLEGRSSVGRLGLFIHITAGFGDVGFSGFWTLEMFCVKPIRIYPGVEIGQIFYHTIEGDFDQYSSNKYQNNQGIQPSMLYKDFQKFL